jgi:hypothetical protein
LTTSALARAAPRLRCSPPRKVAPGAGRPPRFLRRRRANRIGASAPVDFVASTNRKRSHECTATGRHRDPREPAGAVAGRARPGLVAPAGRRGRPARHDHARRPDPGSHAVESRRQGSVRQGARGRAAGRPSGPRGPLAEGRADGTAARVRTRGGHDARGSARLRRVDSLRGARSDAGGRPHRHLEPAPRTDAARALSAPVDPVDPWQRRHPAGEARPWANSTRS